LKLREEIARVPQRAARVRMAARHLTRFTCDDIENMMPGTAIKSIRHAVQDMRKTGEMRLIRRGYFEFVGCEKKRTLLDVVWHLVRSHRHFSTDEIQRLSGAARATVTEYLHCLRKLGFIRQAKRGQWQLVEDPGPSTPVNTAKCQKLKRLRAHGARRKEE